MIAARPGRRARFRAPAPWAWAVTAAAVALFTTLAAWQWQRGLARELLQDRLADRGSLAEVLHAGSRPGGEPRRALALGRFEDQHLLQDGQSHDGQPGYHVWTPLRLADGARVMVNRGWLPNALQPPELAPPAGEVAVSGAWRALPEPGLRLSGTHNCPAQKHFPLKVLYPTVSDLGCLLGPGVLPGLLLMDPEVPGGFVRQWLDGGMPPARHYGYAAQWLALAIAAVVLFWAVNRERA